jgi:hypothetical protein
MTTSKNTPPAQFDAQPIGSIAPTTKPKFHRILVRRKGETKHTTISISPRIYCEMLKFGYGRAEGVNGVLRRAAERVEKADSLQFSHLVRLKALAMLRGAYRPELAGVEERLAADNNAAWSRFANG